MQVEYKLEEDAGYLAAKVTGEWGLEAAYELIDSLERECRERNCRRALADWLDAEIVGRVLEYERFVVGQRIGSRLRDVRLAILFPAVQINKFAESIAVEAGAEFLVTGDREEALSWLLESSKNEAAVSDE